MYVEVCDEADPRSGGQLLLAVVQSAAVAGAGGKNRPTTQGAVGSGSTAADVTGRLTSGRRGLRLRSQRRIRAVPAHQRGAIADLYNVVSAQPASTGHLDNSRAGSSVGS